MALAIAAFMIACTVGLFLVWRSQARDPDRWQRRLAEGRFKRALASVGCISAAAAVGALLGGRGDLAGAALVLGGAAALGSSCFGPTRVRSDRATATISLRFWKLGYWFEA
jgi:hypothetical protein